MMTQNKLEMPATLKSDSKSALVDRRYVSFAAVVICMNGSLIHFDVLEYHSHELGRGTVSNRTAQ
jgi:hypothetical protein